MLKFDKKANFGSGLQELVTNLFEIAPYVKMTNDYNEISSFKNYMLSRIIDKVLTTSINYIRIEQLIELLTFEDVKNITNTCQELDLLEESNIEMIASLLRPLTEIYIDLKIIDFTQKKAGIELEEIFFILYFTTMTDFVQLKRSISKDIYNCDPLYFKNWSDNLYKEMNKIKQSFSGKSIFLLKNMKNKYKGVIDNYGEMERLILGYDYLTHYANLSKKTHLSYTNIPNKSISSKSYLSWCFLYFLLIYDRIIILLKVDSPYREQIDALVNKLMKESKGTIFNYLKKDDIVVFEFGVSRILETDGLTLKVKYLASNCFETGQIDEVPRIFIAAKVSENDFLTIKNKYLPSHKKIYSGKEYIDFYKEITKEKQS